MELLVGGLTLGAVYALVALGVVLVFRATSVVNFAQGEILMVGAYAYQITAGRTDSAVLQLFAALLAGAAGGFVCFVVTHYLLRGASPIVLVMGTLALFVFAQSTARILFTDNARFASAWIFGDQNVSVLGATVATNSLVVLGVTAVATAGLFLWLRTTDYGRSVRAVAEDQWRAALTGIHVKRMLAISWLIGGALAGVAGLLISPTTGVFPAMGAEIIFPAFIAALLGGFTSLPGALVGGLALGLIQTYAVVHVGGALRDVVMFSILLLVLMLKPTGLIGAEKIRTV